MNCCRSSNEFRSKNGRSIESDQVGRINTRASAAASVNASAGRKYHLREHRTMDTATVISTLEPSLRKDDDTGDVVIDPLTNPKTDRETDPKTDPKTEPKTEPKTGPKKCCGLCC